MMNGEWVAFRLLITKNYIESVIIITKNTYNLGIRGGIIIFSS